MIIRGKLTVLPKAIKMGVACDQLILVLRLYPRDITKGVQKVITIRERLATTWMATNGID